MSATKSVFFVSVVFFFFFLTFISVLNYLPNHIISSTGNLQFVRALQYFTIALTLIVGGRFISKIDKTVAVFANFAAISIEGILLVTISSEILRLAIIFTMSAQFSLVLLAMFTWFWSATEPEERGRVTGFTGFVTLPFYFFTADVLLENLDFISTALFGVLLSLGVLFILLMAPRKILTNQKSTITNCHEKRTFLLYSIPWILFSLVNATLALNVSQSVFAQVSPSFYMFLLALQVAGVAFGALVGGIVADVFGRRPSLMISLTLYGIGSALVGLFQNNVIFLVAYAANGLSWGILFMLYVFVVWGDLATEKTVGKMYSIGLAIYYSALGVGLLSPSFSQVPLIATALSSCLFIFLLNVPVILAPELLSSDFSEKIQLKLHVRTVRKIGRKSKNQG
jgi:Sugar (and other) transporter